MGAVLGVILPKWKRNVSSKETLESLEKTLKQLLKARTDSQQCERSMIGLLVFMICFSYPLLLLVGVVMWVWFDHLVTLPMQAIYAMVILLLPLMIYGIKKLINMVFTHKQSQYDASIKSIQEEKRKVLDEVMDKEPYRVARELLEKYDPTNPALKSTTPTRPRQDDDRSVRRRRFETTPSTPHPSAQFQQRPVVTPHPSVQATPHPPVQATPRPPVQATPRPPAQATPRLPAQATPRPPQSTPVSATPQQPDNLGYTLPPGYCLGSAPGPPNPVPILPRDRTTFDKIIDNLVGDGPSNRYALICSTCHSHNGMALRDEYEYLTFRCAYCYNVNPARKKRPSVLQQPPPLPAPPPNNRALTDTQDESPTTGEDTPPSPPTELSNDPSKEHED